MWSPTHIHVTVIRGTNMLIKGKNDSNDAFVTIALGKERYQTSVKEKSNTSVHWNEECELTIPKRANNAEIVLTALNRNFIGDDFLGMVRIPLADFDVSQYQSSFTKWYQLKNKVGKDNTKKRGELEIRIGFLSKPGSTGNAGSLTELTKKGSHRSSFGNFVGGSLLSLGKEKKGLKKLAKAVGNKVSTLPGRGKKKNKEEDGFDTIHEKYISKQNRHEADPGVISDEEDEFRFDELSHKSSHSSLRTESTPRDDGSLENLGGGEFLRKTYATPPSRKSNPIQNIIASTGSKSGNTTNANDDWEAKLFGRNQIVHDSPPSSLVEGKTLITSTSPQLVNPSSKTDVYTPRGNKGNVIPSQNYVTPILNKEVANKPMPLPRQIDEVRNGELKFKSISSEDVSNKKDKKEKSKLNDTFASIFSSSKAKTDDTSNQKTGGTPIGVSSPIRLNETRESYLPKETIKRFEGKSREDLIEMITELQSTVDRQKQRIGDTEDYLETLLVRVMENKPNLLQIPFAVTTHRIKSHGNWNY